VTKKGDRIERMSTECDVYDGECEVNEVGAKKN